MSTVFVNFSVLFLCSRLSNVPYSLGLIVETVEKGINGCIVKSLVDCDAIGEDGRIHVGDYILNINNESLRRVTNAQARAILRRASLLDPDIR